MSLMLDEITEQPAAIAATVCRSADAVQGLADEILRRKIRYVVIAARGTSDNAATYAKYLLEISVGAPVGLAAPSVYTLYQASVRLPDCLALGISQSGQAADVAQALQCARESGALTACITNEPDSPLTAVSDYTLLCRAGTEKSVAATKTYTTSLALIAMLAARWSGDASLETALRAVPDQMRQPLSMDPHIASLVERYRYIQECAVLARGLNQATALEAALKMTETSYVVAKPYSGADFLHGPIAMVSPGFPCFLYAPTGRTLPFMIGLAEKLQERKAETVVVSDSDAILRLATRPIAMTGGIDERLSPLLYVVVGQLLAYRLALARGEDPDRPRGLAKVTLTR